MDLAYNQAVKRTTLPNSPLVKQAATPKKTTLDIMHVHSSVILARDHTTHVILCTVALRLDPPTNRLLAPLPSSRQTSFHNS